MAAIEIKGLLTYEKEFVGVRVQEQQQGLVDIDKDVINAQAQQAAEKGNFRHIELTSVGDKLVSLEEEKQGVIIPVIEVRNDLVTRTEKALVDALQPKAEPKPEPKPEPKAPQPQADKPKAEKKQKTKFYTVLLSVKTMTADGQGIEDREVKRDVEDTNLTNAKMQIREILAKEYDIPMKDVKVLKAGLKK